MASDNEKNSLDFWGLRIFGQSGSSDWQEDPGLLHDRVQRRRQKKTILHRESGFFFVKSQKVLALRNNPERKNPEQNNPGINNPESNIPNKKI